MMDFAITPRQRAIFFDPACDDGATLGHYCTIVEIEPASQQRFRDEPNCWRVLAYFPHMDSYLEVDAGHLLPLRAWDDSQLPPRARPQLELQFAADAEDHERIDGKYRNGQWYWQNFEFAKTDQPRPTWQLRGHVQGSQLALRELVYFVPRSDCLNRDYVRQAMAEIFAGM